MKRISIVAATFALAVASTAVLATAHDRGGNDDRRGPDRAGMMFEQFDLNADGQVTREEIAEAAAQRFAKADTNADGQLSTEELAAAAEARNADQRAKRVANGIERMIKRQDANGDGTLSQEEMTKAMGDDRMDRMFEHLDADEDGTITKAELDAMKGKRGHGQHRRGYGHDRR